MGKYLNENSKGTPLPEIGKVEALIMDGAEKISLSELKEGDVAVVENAFFDAALYVDEYEVGYLNTYNKDGHDIRPMTYLRYQPAKEIIEKTYGEI